MFKVVNDGFITNVYAVRTNEEDTEFLVYFDNQWKWIYANFWKPYIDK